MENLWLVVPAIILGCIGIIWFINWIDNYTPSKPIPKPKPKLGTFRIAPSNVIDMFYVEEYSYTVGMTFGDTLRIDRTEHLAF